MTAADRRRVQILARSLVRDLTVSGLDTRDVVTLAAELVGEVAERKAARRSRRQQRRDDDVNRHDEQLDDRVRDAHAAPASGNTPRSAIDAR
jgi:hypothetical protein